MAWVERDLKDHLVASLLLWAGWPAARPGCPEPHPAWPGMPPGMGHPQPPWATCSLGHHHPVLIFDKVTGAANTHPLQAV